MIIIEPLGGLGNQLFVYGIGLANIRRLKTTLVADLRNFVGYEWHAYELDSFENVICEEITTEVRQTSSFSRRVLSVVRRFDRLGTGSRQVGERVDSLTRRVEEVDNQFDERFLTVSDGSRLRGYFQSWKYLEPVRDELKQSIFNLKQPSDWFTKKKKELGEKPPWIGVHLRLGNYVDLPSMGTVESLYYERALTLLSNLGHNMPIVVFSDSPDLARSLDLWTAFPDITFLDNDNESHSRPIETLSLQSMASHLVIAKRTYSWWAGWLGESHNRRVIYPRPWINNKDIDDRDLPLPGWIGIGREDHSNYR